MSSERPTESGSADTPDEGEDLGPQARSLIISGPIGFQGKGLPPAERRRIFDDLFFEGERRRPYLSRFVVLIVLSALIAALGLANDSAAVVIGAMLIAPLMVPLMGMAYATTMGWPRRMGKRCRKARGAVHAGKTGPTYSARSTGRERE